MYVGAVNTNTSARSIAGFVTIRTEQFTLISEGLVVARGTRITQSGVVAVIAHALSVALASPITL